MSNNKRKRERLYCAAEIMKTYHVSKYAINKFFPHPVRKTKNRYGGPPVRWWNEEQIMDALSDPAVRQSMTSSEPHYDNKERRKAEIESLLLGFDEEKLVAAAMCMNRRFVLHIGPTNSGKTYDSIQRLKTAKNGVYLGPLRLLALEMCDNLNMNGVPCSLLTGEESVPVPFSNHTASTIELANYDEEYEVAVIDEAQMVSEKCRGDKWLKAIYLLNAKEIHVCMAPEARDLIIRIVESFHAPYEIVEHKRLTPLEFMGQFRNLNDVQPGDALIVFSRRSVLAVSAELDKMGIRASVIYGALPPVSRREEVRKFTEGETQVVVATDAIGMGISLPIRRIIFCETEKFDGEERRNLNFTEIKQIAGRAGRFGIYDKGEVLSMSRPFLIKRALENDTPQIQTVYIPFPAETLDSDYSIKELLTAWNSLPKGGEISRVDMSNAIMLYNILKKYASNADKGLVYRLITCPVDCKSQAQVNYWLQSCICILRGHPLPQPFSDTLTLESCETRYRELDIRHQLLRQINVEEDNMQEKDELCKLINDFLSKSKNAYLRRCRSCRKILPATHPYGICEECFEKNYKFY